MDALQLITEQLTVGSTPLFMLGSFPITDTVLMAMFNFLVFVALVAWVQSFRVLNPSKGQLMVESVVMGLKSFLDDLIANAQIASRVTPFISALITYILLSNLMLAFMPWLTGFTYNGAPLFRTHTNDINTTLALAVSMVVASNLVSLLKLNPFGYFFKFVQIDKVVIGFSKSLGEGFMALIGAFVGLLDIVSELAKIISLSLRLFGNIFAGELLLGIFMGFLAVALPLPIMGLSILSGVIQAIVFGILVTSFFTAAMADDEETN